MSSINYVIGNQDISNQGLPTFSNEASLFLDELSKKILSSSESKKYSDLVSFAFWIRKANFQRQKENYPKAINRLGRGLCFHIAPSNIPINFAFSYVFSLLAGNANIVRLPSKSFPQVELLLKLLSSVIVNHPSILKRTAFVKYSRESSATSFFSELADARMIWGGDNTINQVRQLKTKPRAIDITFADRYSFCIIDSDHVLTLKEDELKKLAADFYNDTYLMDQNACSSPQLICWLNSNDQAKELFWKNVYELVAKKYQMEDAIAVEKYTKLCEDSLILENIDSAKSYGNFIYRINLNHIDRDVEKCRGKGGYFYEYDCSLINELTTIISDKYQTVTYLGMKPESIREFIISNHIRGIDRIVPIGKAMDIDVVWDGHDLITELSREIIVR